jgi:archaellum component FlaF (FlaF/FlaG flagellin family)
MSTVTQKLSNYPLLPYPLQVGNLQWSEKLEDYPSGEILYKGNTLEVANAIAAAYPDLKVVTIEGIGFVVAPAGVSVKRSRFGRGDIETYDVTVQLESKWKAKCQRKIGIAPFLQRDAFSKFKYASSVSVSAIASFLGISYIGPAIFYSPEQIETTFEEILRTNCRRLGCFISFSNPQAVKLVAIDGVGDYAFPNSVVIDSGSSKRDPVLPIIDNVLVTGKFSRDPFDEQDALLLPLEPVREVIKQGEDASRLTEKESYGTLTNLDLNFDVSGPKKVYTETTFIDNIVVKEISKTYGFAYRGIDIAVFGNIQGVNTIIKLNGSPQLYWTQVEEQITDYNYESITSDFNVIATYEGRTVSIYVNPDSVNILSVNGNQVFLKNAKYLLGTKTSGWKLVRLQKEETKPLGSWVKAPPAVSAQTYQTLRYGAELCRFNKVEIRGSSGVEVEPLRKLYGKSTPIPFTLEVKKYTDLDPSTITRAGIPARLIERNGVMVVDPEYVVGIVSANVSDSEPYWLKSESSFRSAFTYGKSPKYNPYLPDNTQKLRKAGDVSPEYIFAGDESYTSAVRRVFVDSKDQNITGKSSSEPFDYAELYEEVLLNDTAQGPNFLEAASEATKEIKRGKPPIAQVQLKRWGTAKEKARIASPNSVRRYTYAKYYATSDLLTTFPADIILRYTDSDVIDLPYANTVQEAQKTLETDLRVAGMNNAIAAKKLAWYYPNIRVGDRVTFSEGRLRAISVSNNLEYRGLQNGALMVVSEGTQVECGYDKARSVTIKQATYSRNLDSEIAPDVRIKGNDSISAGEFVYNTSRRRDFNAKR